MEEVEAREELLHSSMRNPLFEDTGQAAAGRTRGPRGVSAPVKEPRGDLSSSTGDGEEGGDMCWGGAGVVVDRGSD